MALLQEFALPARYAIFSPPAPVRRGDAALPAPGGLAVPLPSGLRLQTARLGVAFLPRCTARLLRLCCETSVPARSPRPHKTGKTGKDRIPGR